MDVYNGHLYIPNYPLNYAECPFLYFYTEASCTVVVGRGGAYLTYFMVSLIYNNVSYYETHIVCVISFCGGNCSKGSGVKTAIFSSRKRSGIKV